MRTNIMLCFLSDVKLDRKTGAISAVDYQNIGEKKRCHTTNESAVRYLLSSRMSATRIMKALRGPPVTSTWRIISVSGRSFRTSFA